MQDPFAGLSGGSPAARAAIDIARRAARSDIPLLIGGESGVGKEVLARAIHAASPRAKGPFVPVNCGALPEGLIESILFGHARGAFTGAVEARAGKFVEADGGTLFLDEIGELPLEAQAKLLRALQEREVDPLGAPRARSVDIRVLSATNRDLAADLTAGRFRQDLYYRLNVLSLRLPSLRERRADIVALADALLARLAAPRPAPCLAPEALDRLESADWPGNIRELENALHRALVLSDGETLGPELFDALHPPSAPDAPPPAPHGAVHRALDAAGLPLTLAELEARHILFTLDRCDGVVADAARALGIGRSTLYRKLEELQDRRLRALGREPTDAVDSDAKRA